MLTDQNDSMFVGNIPLDSVCTLTCKSSFNRNGDHPHIETNMNIIIIVFEIQNRIHTFIE